MNNISLFIAGAIALIVAPGPDFLYVMSRGVSQGRTAGVLSALGISLGLLTHTLLAAIGLTALLTSAPMVFEIVKYAGALYLAYMGIQIIRKRQTAFKIETRANSDLPGKIVRQGILTNLFNPKALITFMAFIPPFISPEGSRSIQVGILGGMMVCFGLSWFSMVGYFSGTLGERLLNSRYALIINWTAGCILMGLAVHLLFES